ncbi:bile acid:sodium symporter family protein [uncultured Tolumonas sp.]|uniref:bile acid:sodium symporter family protein n=1 Tax=uncultured Tolumonas sp. TaxID=263765 RepID=UPI0037491197
MFSGLSRLFPDRFTLLLISTVTLASFLPCQGTTAVIFNQVADIAIALLFFLHGAKLSRGAVLAGITHWRLHLLVMSLTFLLFPIIGLLLQPLLTPLVGPVIYQGILYLCCLPATVQSAIAFTSMAKGNVPAAVCSASASSLLGIFVTPILVSLVLAKGTGNSDLHGISKILLQLLLPFVTGHLLQPWIGGFVTKHKKVLGIVDRGSILLVVYTAFSAAVIEHLWSTVPMSSLLGLLVVCIVILAAALLSSRLISRRLGFSVQDEITIVFCGSKKSLVSGVPMAKVLFAGAHLGPILLPIMLFHQIQLMVCAVLAQRYAKRMTE